MKNTFGAMPTCISIGFVLVLALAGCAPAGSTSDSQVAGGGTITIGQVAEPTHVPDPIVDGSLAGYNYYFNVFDQLTTFDAEGDIQPRLSTEWTSNEDFTQWTFNVRDDVKFHNGEPLTAADVVFTYETILATADSDPASYMEMLESTEEGADGTVVFNLDAPFSAWPTITTGVSIVPESVYTELGSEGFAAAPVGSGPFIFEKYTRGVEYVINKNDDYWGTKATIDQAIFQTVADSEARLNGVSSGSLDIALIAPNQVSSLEGADNVSVKSLPSNGVTFLGMNSTAGPLADPLVRQAITLAIDREAIVDSVLAGLGTANSQLVAPNVGGFSDDYPAPAFDPDEARRLLAKAGYAGEPIPLEYAVEGRIPLSSEVVQVIQGFLSDVGVVVELQGMDQGSFSTVVYGSKTAKGIYLNTYAPSTIDGDAPIASIFGAQQNDYALDQATTALVEKTRTVDGQDRIDVYSELFTLNDAESYVIGLYTPDNNFAVNPELKWEPRADGLVVLNLATFAG